MNGIRTPLPDLSCHSAVCFFVALLAAAGLLELFLHFVTPLPAPGMILTLAVVFIAYNGGLIPAVVAVLASTIYLLAGFYVRFEESGIAKIPALELVVEIITMSLFALLVVRLRELSARTHQLETAAKEGQLESMRLFNAQSERQRFAAILEGTTDLVILADKSGRVIYLNAAARERVGAIGQEAERYMLADLHLPVQGGDALTQMFAVADSKGSWRGRCRIRTLSGDEVLCSGVVVPYRDDQDLVIGYAAIHRDLAEELNAQEQLENAYKELRFHVDNTPMAVVEWDKDMRITRWSGMAQQIFGWKESEVVGMHPFEFPLVHTDDFPRIKQAVDNLQNLAALEIMVENRNYTKNGDVIICEWHNSVMLDANNRLRSILSLVSDVTAERDRRDELKTQNENLEKLIADRTERIRALENQRGELERFVSTGRMAARIAHEVNNPLASIKNVATLLRDPLLPSTDREYWLGVLLREVERIAGIVRQMYQLYRPVDVELSAANFHRIFSDLKVLAGPRFDAKGVSLGIRAVPNDLEPIHTSENLLTQMLLSLLDNALDVSAPGSVVDIELRAESDSVTVTVRDKGPGIAEEIRNRIFEPFFTTKRSNGSGSNGFGLGLSVARSLAHSLGGELGLSESTPAGSTFFVKLPRLAADSVLRREPKADRSSLAVESHTISGIAP